jgi:hypothetical protein
MKKLIPPLVLFGSILFVGCQTSSPSQIVHSPQLNKLAKEYSQPEIARSEASVETKKWHHMDYPPLVVKSAHGDVRALETLIKLNLDGAAGEEQAANLATLLRGLDDQTVATALKQCSAEERRRAFDCMDYDTVFFDNPANRKKYPLTFSLKQSH